MQATLKDRIDQIIQKGLKDGRTDLEVLPNGHVCGHVVSSEFERLDFEERRKRIRVLLGEAVDAGHLLDSDLKRVSTLLTYTPDEWSIATSDLASDN